MMLADEAGLLNRWPDHSPNGCIFTWEKCADKRVRLFSSRSIWGNLFCFLCGI